MGKVFFRKGKGKELGSWIGKRPLPEGVHRIIISNRNKLRILRTGKTKTHVCVLNALMRDKFLEKGIAHRRIFAILKTDTKSICKYPS